MPLGVERVTGDERLRETNGTTGQDENAVKDEKVLIRMKHVPLAE